MIRIWLYICLFSALCFGFNIDSIEADFTQNLNDGQNNINYSGKLFARADGMVFWSYEKPFRKDIYANKNEVIIFEPELNQAIISRKMKIDFVGILNSIQERDNQLISVVNDVEYIIGLKDGKPTSIFYKDELDNEIKIELKNVVLDKKIDDKIFKFAIPKGVDVIYE